MKIDHIDYKLIELLQKNCKQTTKELADQLDLSTTAVYERVKKLEKQNIITDYVAVINKEKINRNFMAIAHIKIKSHSKDAILKFENKVNAIPEIVECFNVSGEFDYILKIGVQDMEAYREFMISKLTTMEEVQSTHSSFVIKEVKNSKTFSIL
ncbi:Lrp/AsnC family transcriptional regulator [Flavobacterium sp. xlx-214]|uniref:Lrp/AsnC family transcriptional regulator n=1 Tax=unclassified Flavobacterium TaxID=196869 RepID=UPI0013D01664|nr:MULTISPECIES: Lrp/AsnC family transcriptional regulator [unclassified Flavobacterium]MBA5791179.1 Lrp/AsnC family transcriptional regulator [Flavobacterium sp. xlx-221]QMI83651.1 Lrp/AsnC family transcriptional regulator [Flavobacterium sp. xlx-214]